MRRYNIAIILLTMLIANSMSAVIFIDMTKRASLPHTLDLQVGDIV